MIWCHPPHAFPPHTSHLALRQSFIAWRSCIRLCFGTAGIHHFPTVFEPGWVDWHNREPLELTAVLIVDLHARFVRRSCVDAACDESSHRSKHFDMKMQKHTNATTSPRMNAPTYPITNLAHSLRRMAQTHLCTLRPCRLPTHAVR